mgnify:FL=1
MKKKIKIFVFNPYPAIGGVDTSLKRFLLSLGKNYEIEYLSLRKAENFKRSNIKNTIINSKSTLISFFKIYKIYKNSTHDKKFFFSIQYFVNIWSIIFIKLILRGKLFIYDVNHLDEFNHFDNSLDYIKKKIIKFLVKYLYKYADIAASNSKELSSDLSKYTNKKINTIYNPCFKKIIKRRNPYKIKGQIKVLNISRFEKQKDHLTIIKAIKHSKLEKKIELTLVGYGSEYKKIRNEINKNRIKSKILTNKKELDKFYKNSNLYVCSSLYEGLPTTVIEAASYCLPIISSNFKSGSKEIFYNGKGGYIFKAGDYKSLSEYLIRFYNNPKSFYRKERFCRKNLHRFSIKRNTNLFLNLIKKLV